MQPSTSGTQPFRRSERIASESVDKRKKTRQEIYLSSGSDDEEDEDIGKKGGQPVCMIRVKIDRRQLVQDVAHYFLACVSSANRGYGKETEVRKLFINTGGKDFREDVVAEVITKLDDVFGVKVHHDKQGQRYFLTKKNIIPAAFNELDCMERTSEETTSDDGDKFRDGLLLSALTFIFMTKRHVMKDEAGIDAKLLQKFLEGVDNVQEDVFRVFFGPAKTAEFLAQGWITCNVNRDLSGNEEVQYDWGPRAEMTVDKKKILAYFCDIYGSELSAWPRCPMENRAKRAAEIIRRVTSEHGKLERDEPDLNIVFKKNLEEVECVAMDQARLRSSEEAKRARIQEATMRAEQLEREAEATQRKISTLAERTRELEEDIAQEGKLVEAMQSLPSRVDTRGNRSRCKINDA